jgi:hypothetical protein
MLSERAEMLGALKPTLSAIVKASLNLGIKEPPGLGGFPLVVGNL